MLASGLDKHAHPHSLAPTGEETSSASHAPITTRDYQMGLGNRIIHRSLLARLQWSLLSHLEFLTPKF